MKKIYCLFLILLATSLTARSARVSFDFSHFAIGKTFSLTGSGNSSATVAGNPTGSGKILIVKCNEWGQIPMIPVELPSGITLGNCSSISAKMYIPTQGNEQYANYKQIQIYINGNEVFRNLKPDGSDDYPQQGEKDTWLNKSYDISALSLNAEMPNLSSFTLGIGLNDSQMTYYISELTLSYDLNLDPPALPAMGAYYTGQYRNLFAEAGYDESVVESRINDLWATYFEGDDDNERLYYPVGNDMAYILDVNNNDVRTEGMSYGMMICVQLNKKAEFDALWKWAKTYMQHADDKENGGYFAWQCNRDGSQKDGNTASDGEEYIITALMFASNRWGDGQGIFNYSREANHILEMSAKKPTTPYSPYTPLFNPDEMQVVFVPFASAARFTDPSYHLPAFYELWGQWADSNKDFYQRLAEKSREMFPKFANSTTGLMPDYAEFDGRPHNGDGDHADFLYDAWRCIMNMSIDYAWFKPESCDYVSLVQRIHNFFLSKGITEYHSLYTLDGNDKNGNTDHSPGLVACNASGALASGKRDAWKFIDNFVDTAVPTGKFRYYDGCLYFLNWLNCAGRYRIYGPDSHTGIHTPGVSDSNDLTMTVTQNGIRLDGIDNGSYTLISLPSGITVSAGQFENGIIPTAGLNAGLYVLSVPTCHGISKALKFRLQP